MMKIDIGCGLNKQPGYIGMDRYEMTGPDIICDMNKRLPLEDNTVQRVIASHSLEHADDLVFTMQEIYRICEDRAIICIVAPYYYTSLNMANPYHKQVFNEHTPRFFTKDNYTPLQESDYDMPHARAWALGESDNSDLQLELKCIRIEFFYFEKYRYLSEEEKAEARKKDINVVDQIMYHFLVTKTPIDENELNAIASSNLEEPSYVTIRRLAEKNEELRLSAMKNEIESKEYQKQLQACKRNENVKYKELEKKLKEVKQQHENELSKEISDLKYLFIEQNEIRENKLLKLSDVIKAKQRDMSPNLNENVRDLMANNLLQTKQDLNRYILSRSHFVMPGDIIYYDIHPDTKNLQRINVSMTNLCTKMHKTVLALEILDQHGNIVRSIGISASSIKHNGITSISFEPLPDSCDSSYTVRFVGMEGSEGCGISIYEWQKLSLMKKNRKKAIFSQLIYR